MRSNILSLAAVAASMVAPTVAFWRLPCQGRLGVARMDPLVNPGEASPHAHAIHGAGNFAMSVTQDLLMDSDCTSCGVTQDKSAYWVPGLYFVRPDGSAELVDQVGGTLVYYLLRGENIKAFPKDFRLLAGDPNQRNFTLPVPDPPKSTWTDDSQFDLAQKALGFNCLNYDVAAEPSLYRHSLPTKEHMDNNCKDGIRVELMFPSCWNGKDLDSDDHKSHMAYPSMMDNGDCPKGFGTRTPSLFYETIWNTHAYAGEAGEFVFANGDPTGYGYHADFIGGWEDGVLEAAVNQCTNESGRVEDCPVFNLQDVNKQNECKMSLPSILTGESYDIIKKGLPGDVPIRRGPAYAKDAPEEPEEPEPLPTLPYVSDDGNQFQEIGPTPPAKPVKGPAGAGFYEKPSGQMNDVVDAPETTAPPETTAAPTTPEKPVRTSTYTESNTVYNVVIYEEEVTETVEVSPEATAEGNQKRHAHVHGHGRRRQH